MSVLEKNEAILNFTFLTASFYNYLQKSNKIFKTLNLGSIDDIEKQFKSLNQKNYENHFDESLYVNMDETNELKAKKIICLFY